MPIALISSGGDLLLGPGGEALVLPFIYPEPIAQSAQVGSLDSGTTQAFTFSQPVPNGSSIIVTLVNFPGVSPLSGTDNFGNTYTRRVSTVADSNLADVWDSLGIVSDNVTNLVVTFTFAGIGNYNTGVATAFAGKLTFDQIGSVNNSLTVTAAAANTQDVSLEVVSAVVNGGTDDAAFTTPAGWTLLWRQNDSNTTEGGQGIFKAVVGIETATVTQAAPGLPGPAALNQALATYGAAPDPAQVLETLAPTDSSNGTVAGTLNAARAETAATTDAQAATLAATAARAETAAATDSAAATGATTAAGADSAAVTDSQAAAQASTAAGADSAAATDVQAATSALAQAQAETVATTDAGTASMAATQAQADSAAVADSATATAAGDYVASTAETLAATEAQAAVQVGTAAAADSVAATDTSDALASGAYAAAAADSATPADSQVATMQAAQAVAETTAATDTVDALAANYQAAQAEAAQPADSASAAAAFEAAAANSATPADTSNALPAGAFLAEASDTLDVTDSATGVSDNVPSDLDAKFIGGGKNVKFKPLREPVKVHELPLPADITNLPDAPPAPKPRESGLLASLAMNIEIPGATPAPPVKSVVAPAPVSAPQQVARVIEPEPEVAPPAPAPVHLGPSPEHVAALEASQRALQQRIEELETKLQAAHVLMREEELDRQAEAIYERIRARREENDRRVKEIVNKFMRSH